MTSSKVLNLQTCNFLRYFTIFHCPQRSYYWNLKCYSKHRTKTQKYFFFVSAKYVWMFQSTFRVTSTERRQECKQFSARLSIMVMPVIKIIHQVFQSLSQVTCTCLKSTIEILKKGAKYTQKFHPNALTPSIHLKFIHTETNLQLSAKILFKHV